MLFDFIFRPNFFEHHDLWDCDHGLASQDPSMSDEDADVDQKVLEIFRSAVGDRANVLPGEFNNQNTRNIMASALTTRFGERLAKDIAFHLTDWNSNAAFILAMHLFPERFKPEQIIDGVEDFLVHAPNHVAAAAKLGGYPVDDIFNVGALDRGDDAFGQ